MDSMTDDDFKIAPDDAPSLPAPAPAARTAPFYDYDISTIVAPEYAPRPQMLPVGTIGYYYRDLANHGPIIRFWSFHECKNLISFVNWHALTQRPFEVLAAIKDRGAPLRKLEGTAYSQLQASMWVHDLQYHALDARMLAQLGALIATPLPEGVLPPRLIATLRPEHTAPEWLEASSTADVHEQFATQLQRVSVGLLH